MRFRKVDGWMPMWVEVAIALAAGGSDRADVCVVINPVLDIGCRDVQGAPAGGEPTASSEPAGAPREQEPARRSSTVVRYGPNPVAVTFQPGVTRPRGAAAASPPPGRARGGASRSSPPPPLRRR